VFIPISVYLRLSAVKKTSSVGFAALNPTYAFHQKNIYLCQSPSAFICVYLRLKKTNSRGSFTQIYPSPYLNKPALTPPITSIRSRFGGDFIREL
jgi:hypothetical protein